VVGLVGVEGGWSRGCRGFASVVFVAGVFLERCRSRRGFRGRGFVR
jgi:hypothetical protein